MYTQIWRHKNRSVIHLFSRFSLPTSFRRFLWRHTRHFLLSPLLFGDIKEIRLITLKATKNQLHPKILLEYFKTFLIVGVFWLPSVFLLFMVIHQSVGLQCYQCANTDGKVCPYDATTFTSNSHDACITWRLGNGSIILQVNKIIDFI